MVNVKFHHCGEIRMGSPHNLCRLTLTGEWTPELPFQDWQNLSAQSKDKRILGLIAWDVQNNEPGFRVIIVNARTRTVSVGDRIPGCCRSIEWDGSGFKYECSGWVQV